MTSRRYKIGVLVSSPSKQLCGQYDRVAALDGYELWLIYRNLRQDNPAWSPALPASGRYEFLPQSKLRLPGRLGSFFSANPLPVLSRHDFDGLIIHGIYDNLAVWRAISWCRRNKKPYMLRCDANICHERGFIKKRLLKPLIKRNIKGASALLSIGLRNSQYYRYFGGREEQLFNAPWEIDYEALEQFYQEASNYRVAIRDRLGFADNETIIVTVGRLIKRKGFDVLIDAVAQLSSAGFKVKLAVVGEGPYRQQIVKNAKNKSCPLFLAGNLDRKGVVQCLTASDIFALASFYEPWGLVVNEAALCGLPLVLSSLVGAGPDLVKCGVNGLLFSSDSGEELYEQLKEIIEARKARKMGASSRDIIKQWICQNPALEGYRKALDLVSKKSYEN